jgi:hypothetical protein
MSIGHSIRAAHTASGFSNGIEKNFGGIGTLCLPEGSSLIEGKNETGIANSLGSQRTRSDIPALSLN